MLFSLVKSLKAMDAYIIVRDFFGDVDGIVTSQINTEDVPLQRNIYIRLACGTVFAGLIVAEITAYRIRQTHKLNLRNIITFFSSDKQTVQRLKIKHVDKTMMHIFFNSFTMVMVGLTTQSDIAICLLLGSNLFALGALSYMTFPQEQKHATIVLRMASAVLTITAILESLFRRDLK